jgi:hypothetical protein
MHAQLLPVTLGRFGANEKWVVGAAGPGRRNGMVGAYP